MGLPAPIVAVPWHYWLAWPLLIGTILCCLALGIAYIRKIVIPRWAWQQLHQPQSAQVPSLPAGTQSAAVPPAERRDASAA